MHVGDISFINIKGNSKPYGSEVIKVHRLLKNEVPHNEYALITESVLESSSGNSSNIDMKPLIGKYDFGEINYNYYSLSEHKPSRDSSMAKKLPAANIILSKEVVISAPIEEVYENLTNFSIKSKWQPGIKSMRFNPKEINRSGSKHQCIFDNFQIEFETFKVNSDGSFAYSFGEITKDIPLFESAANIYKLSKETETSALVRIEFWSNAKGWKKLAVPFLKKRFTKNLKSLLHALKEYSEN
jgi:hypothetical protein